MRSLTAAAASLADRAGASSAGRAAETVVQGDRFRQVLLGLRAGGCLADHQNPGEASLHCISGSVTLTAGESSWDLRAGDIVLIPQAVHRVEAHEDSVVLLSVVLG